MVGDCSDCVPNAICACPCREGQTGTANTLSSTSRPNWRAKNFGHQLSERGACGDPSHTAVSFLECCHTVANRNGRGCGMRRAPGKILCGQKGKLCDFKIISSTPATFRCTAETLHELLHIQIQWTCEVELEHLSRDLPDLVLRPPVLQLVKSCLIPSRPNSLLSTPDGALDTCPCCTRLWAALPRLSSSVQ